MVHETKEEITLTCDFLPPDLDPDVAVCLVCCDFGLVLDDDAEAVELLDLSKKPAASVDCSICIT